MQEFVPYENEVGIFYYRYPDEAKGHISGIVEKEFLAITGDGVSEHGRIIAKRQTIYSPITCIEKNIWQRIKKDSETGRRVFAGALWQSCAGS